MKNLQKGRTPEKHVKPLATGWCRAYFGDAIRRAKNFSTDKLMLRRFSYTKKLDSCREHPQMRLACVKPTSEDAPYTSKKATA